MNKLLTFQGAQPVYLGDIDFMQDAADSCFKMLAKALVGQGSDSLDAILQGVVITNPTVNETHISSGVVVLNGELLPIQEALLNIPGGTDLYFHVSSSLSSERTFKDGSTHKCHDTRRAIINAVSADGIAVSSVPRLKEPSDDYVYTSENVTGNVVGGRLVRKNGFWFMDIEFNIPQSSDSIGSITFSGLTINHLGSLDEISFPLDVLLRHSTVVNVIQPMYCTITKDTLTLGTVILTFQFAEVSPEYGTGRGRVMIPIF